jgi:hypothetical protein
MRNRKEYRRSAVDRAVRPYTSAVMIDDALNRSQPDACPRKIRGIVQALEGLEERAGVGHVESGVRAVNFQALPNKLSSSTRISPGSACAESPV